MRWREVIPWWEFMGNIWGIFGKKLGNMKNWGIWWANLLVSATFRNESILFNTDGCKWEISPAKMATCNRLQRTWTFLWNSGLLFLEPCLGPLVPGCWTLGRWFQHILNDRGNSGKWVAKVGRWSCSHRYFEGSNPGIPVTPKYLRFMDAHPPISSPQKKANPHAVCRWSCTSPWSTTTFARPNWEFWSSENGVCPMPLLGPPSALCRYAHVNPKYPKIYG